MLKGLIKGIKALWKGHMTVLKYALEKRATLEYPEIKRETGKNFRSIIEHIRDENGNLLCTGCGICQKVCPCKDLIKIEREKIDSGKVVLVKYEIDLAQCIFCGNCVENCPQKALKYTQEYELASTDKSKLIKITKG